MTPRKAKGSGMSPIDFEASAERAERTVRLENRFRCPICHMAVRKNGKQDKSARRVEYECGTVVKIVQSAFNFSVDIEKKCIDKK